MASTANTLWSFEPVPFYAQKNEKLLCPCLKNPSSTDNIFKQLGRPQAHAWNWTAAWKQPGLKKKITMTLNSGDQKTKKKAKHKWLLVHGRETEATRYYAFHGFSVPQFQPTALYMLNMATDPEKRKLSSQKKTHMLHQVARIIDPTLHGLIQSQFLHTTRRQCLCPLKVPSSKLISW